MTKYGGSPSENEELEIKCFQKLKFFLKTRFTMKKVVSSNLLSADA